jgi:uncharacterized protein (TIGR00255 family)
MPLKSMTGFARDDGAAGRYTWFWEVRTVNGRGRDVRMRLPLGYEFLEEACRPLINDYIVRGSCNISLKVERVTGDQEIRLNEAALAQIARAIRRAEMFIDAAEPRLDGILGLRGVLEIKEPEHSAEEMAEFTAAVLDSLRKSLEKVVVARVDEGAHLSEALSQQLDQIETLVSVVQRSPARSPEAVKTKLAEQLRRLFDGDNKFNEDRLYQEAVLIATRADVEEELTRLRAHIASVRGLLASEEAVGRKLDFIAQEFNREANTICSKSNALEITNAGLEMKTIIDQMKEQVQNIE